MSSVHKEAVELFYEKSMDALDAPAIERMEQCVEQARKRAKEYLEVLNKEWAKEKGQHWLEEQGD